MSTSDLMELVNLVRKASGMQTKPIPPELKEQERKVRALKREIELMRFEGRPEEEIAPLIGQLATEESKLLEMLRKIREGT